MPAYGPHLPVESRCPTIIKETGEQCKNAAVYGLTHCRAHSTRTHRAAGRRRTAKAKALIYTSRMIRTGGLTASPEEHLIDTLVRADALVIYWGELIARMDEVGHARTLAGADRFRGELRYSLPTDELDELSVSSEEPLLGFNRHGDAAVHPFVEEYNKALKLKMTAAKLCLDAGIAERQIRVKEEQGRMLAGAVRGITAALEQRLGVQIAAQEWYPALVREQLLLNAGTPPAA